MRIGLFTVPFHGYPFEEALDKAVALGVTAVEIGAGGYPGSNHCPVAELLARAERRQEFMEAVTSRGLIVSAFSVHNNPLHPNKETAETADQSAARCPSPGPTARAFQWSTPSPACLAERRRTACPIG